MPNIDQEEIDQFHRLVREHEMMLEAIEAVIENPVCPWCERHRPDYNSWAFPHYDDCKGNNTLTAIKEGK